jgi:HPt (histidine-containing phosphotransfer) domain-containing protein
MRKTILGGILAALLLTAGCGGSGGDGALSGEEYEATIVEIGDTLEQAFADVATEAQSVSQDIGSLDEAGEAFDSLAQTVAQGADALTDAAAELDSLEPPDDAADANQALAAGLRALSSDLSELEEALQGGDFSQIVQLGNELQEIATSEAGTQIEAAIQELQSLGYDVQGDDG